MKDSVTKTTKASLYNVQPTPHTIKQQVFPSLPYTKANLNFINKVSFHFAALTDTEYVTLGSLLLKYKTWYATQKRCW